MKPQVPGYRLLEHLGSGGIADVYRGIPEGGAEPVAIKVHRESMRSASHDRRFLREGYLLQRLDHPGLPRCLDIIAGPIPTIVLELLEGQTLAGAVRSEGPLDPDAVYRVATSVLRILDYLHQNGVLHRDIKASNIYLHRDGRVMLVDLGLAMDPSDPLTTTLGDVLGTYAYMAPEQIAGAELDHRADLYSLGITLYEALAGSRPFKASGTLGYLRVHRRGEARNLGERVPGAPPRLTELIHHLMARDPSDRPPSAGVALGLLTGQSQLHRDLRPPPLVGRWAALGAIEGVLHQKGVLHLVGEVGSGTGRMAHVALQKARELPAETLATRCRTAGTSRSLLSQMAGGLSLVMQTSIPSTEPYLVEAFEQLAGEGPFLLLVEDVHLAEPEALDALARIVERVTDITVITTGLFAPTGLPGRVVRLRPLLHGELRELVVGMLGTSSPPGDLLTVLHRETGGQPALAVLALRELHKQGALRCRGVGTGGEPDWRMDPTISRLETVMSRSSFRWLLERLEPSVRCLLDLLALADEPLPLPVLLEAAGLDPSGLEVNRLERVGLVSIEDRNGEPWVRVRRSMVGHAIRTDIRPNRRPDLHRALARALNRWDASGWQQERAALHEALGARPEDAAPRLLHQAEQAIRRGEHRRALDLLSHLNLVENNEVGVAIDQAILRGEALLGHGNWSVAIDAFGAARKLALDARLPERGARATVGLVLARRDSGDVRRAESLALDLLEDLHGLRGATGIRPPLELFLGQVAWWRGDEKAARSAFRTALTAARLEGSRELALEARLGILHLHADTGRQPLVNQEIRREVERVERAPRASSVPAVARLYTTASVVTRQEGHLALADRHACRGMEVARKLEQPYLEALAGTALAMVRLVAGDRDGAQDLLQRHRVAGSPRADARTRLFYLLSRGELCFEIGDRQAALAAFDQAVDLGRQMGYHAAVAYAEGMVGVLTADAGALGESIGALSGGRSCRWLARVLMSGAEVVGDPDTLAAAVMNARRAGDRPLLLRGLLAMGGGDAREEASEIADLMLREAGDNYEVLLRGDPAVRWARG